MTALSSVFASVGGSARAATRMVICGVSLVLRSSVSVESESTRSHVLAPDSSHELAAHTWTSVVGNELADAFAEKGALLHEIPAEVVKTRGG